MLHEKFKNYERGKKGAVIAEGLRVIINTLWKARYESDPAIFRTRWVDQVILQFFLMSKWICSVYCMGNLIPKCSRYVSCKSFTCWLR